MLDIQLSSYEFRTYRKRDGRISLRHRSYLLVPTNGSFSLSTYLAKITAQLTLPDSTEVEIEEITFSDAVQFKYDGETMVHLFRFSHVTARTEILPGLGHLRIGYEFQFAGHPDARRHEHPAIVKALPYCRTSARRLA